MKTSPGGKRHEDNAKYRISGLADPSLLSRHSCTEPPALSDMQQGFFPVPPQTPEVATLPTPILQMLPQRLGEVMPLAQDHQAAWGPAQACLVFPRPRCPSEGRALVTGGWAEGQGGTRAPAGGWGTLLPSLVRLREAAGSGAAWGHSASLTFYYVLPRKAPLGLRSEKQDNSVCDVAGGFGGNVHDAMLGQEK